MADQVCKPILDANNVKKRELAPSIKRRKQIDIGAWLCLVSRHRAEKGESGNTSGPKLRLVCPKSGYDLVPFHATEIMLMRQFSQNHLYKERAGGGDALGEAVVERVHCRDPPAGHAHRA